jgi:hypothetical protein
MPGSPECVPHADIPDLVDVPGGMRKIQDAHRLRAVKINKILLPIRSIHHSSRLSGVLHSPPNPQSPALCDFHRVRASLILALSLSEGCGDTTSRPTRQSPASSNLQYLRTSATRISELQTMFDPSKRTPCRSLAARTRSRIDADDSPKRSLLSFS